MAAIKKQVKQARTGRRPKKDPRMVRGMRAGKSWWRWLDVTSTSLQEEPAGLIALALAEYAATHGLPPPPKRL